MVLVTGPTGSGKTTTLYATLHEISTMDVTTFTLEDPVEYRMPLVRCKHEIKEEIGLTFSSGLRALLRQDPDIILVGETRDTETAQLMVRAALTGHLVLSTLHTNDAAGADAAPGGYGGWNRICCRPASTRCWPSGWCGPFAGIARRPSRTRKRCLRS